MKTITNLGFSFILLFALAPELSAQSDSLKAGADPSEAGRRYGWEKLRLQDPATGQIPPYIRQKEIAYVATLPHDGMAGSGKLGGSAWMLRGPWNVGGRTRAFALDVNNENTMLAGSVSGALWRSADGGATWTNLTPALEYHGVSCITQDIRPGKNNVWYYGTGEPYGQSASATGAYYQGNGIYKSTDNGLTWTILPSTSSGTPHTFDYWDDIWNIALNPADTVNDVIYAAATYQVMKSINGGASWTAVKSGSCYYTDVQVTSAGVVYMTLSSEGANRGIYRSADGVNWTKITPPNFPATYKRIVIGIAPQDENQVYFLANTPGSGRADSMSFEGSVDWNSLWKYRYISGNGDSAGGQWQDLSMNIPSSKPSGFINFHAQGSYNMVVKVSPYDTNTVIIGGTNLFLSTSGFLDSLTTIHIGGYDRNATSFLKDIDVAYPNHHSDNHVLIFSPSDSSTLYSAHDGGLSKTTNMFDTAVTWISLNNGYITSQFYTVAIDHGPGNTDTIIGGLQDNGTFYSGNSTLTTPWTHSGGADGASCAITDGGAFYYIGHNSGPLFKKQLDANGDPTAFRRINPIGGSGYNWIAPFKLDPNDNNIMYLGAGKYLWRNSDLSQIPLDNKLDTISTNWTRFPDTIPVTNASITAIEVCKTPANRVYYGSSNKRIYRIDNANAGVPSRVEITNNIGSSGYISSIDSDPRDGNKVVVTFSNYNQHSVYYSTDAGSTWTKVGGNLEPNQTTGSGPGPSVRWISILPVSDGVVYLLATSAGLFATDTLMGASTVWVRQAASTIGNMVCDMIDVRESDGWVAVATHAQGIYTAYIKSKNDIVSTKDLAKMDDLELRNYPNPFNHTTAIEFVTRSSGRVRVTVYDELGRITDVLMDEEKAPGRHKVIFNGSNRPAGVYYYGVEAGEVWLVRKMVINN